LTRRIVSLLIAAAVSSGCAGPRSSTAGRNGDTAREAKRDRAAAAAIPDGDGPVERMTVGSETTHAADMWREIGDDLEVKLRDVPDSGRAQFIAERSARWIADKIAEALLYQQASLRLGPEVGKNVDRFVDAEIRKIVTDEHQGVERRFEKHLAVKGQTIEDVRERLRREIMVSSFLDGEVRPKVAEPTRAELLAVYNENMDAWRRPTRCRMSLIDVRVLDRLAEGVTLPTRTQMDAARAEARSRIDAARMAVNQGMAFPEVARQYSDGLHATEGGSWGWVSPGSVRPRFEPAVESLYRLGAGQVSDIIETPESFFLVRCDERQGGEEPSFTAVQPELIERYSRLAFNRLVSERVAKLRAEASIQPANLERFHVAVIEATLKQMNTVGVALP